MTISASSSFSIQKYLAVSSLTSGKRVNDALETYCFDSYFGEFPSLRSLSGPLIPHASLGERSKASCQDIRKNDGYRSTLHNTTTATGRTYKLG